MRIIIHISDLHFGRTEPVRVAALTDFIKRAGADLLVVSGDLTQRARSSEFEQARNFLEQFSVPQIVVPGNHDVPLYNILSRFRNPLKNYGRHIGSLGLPWYEDEEIAIAGLDSTKSFTIQGGKTRSHELEEVAARFSLLPDGITKMIAIHHPFIAPNEGIADRKLLGKSEALKQLLQECSVSALLSGHLHASHNSRAELAHVGRSRDVLIIHAGTALGARTRSEPASFNIIRIDRGRIQIEIQGWNEEAQSYVQRLDPGRPLAV